MVSHKRGGGHIFVADPSGIGVGVLCLHDTFLSAQYLMNQYAILAKFAWIYHCDFLMN